MKKFVNIIEELRNVGSYESFSEDIFSFAKTLEFSGDEIIFDRQLISLLAFFSVYFVA